MRKALWTIALAALAPAVLAQEKKPAAPAEAPAVTEEGTQRPAIRVLRTPYDLASFYRSGGGSPEGWAGLANDPAYAIAGAYRSQDVSGEARRSPYGWSRFWTSGYSARRPLPFPAYRRTLGENGDLYLVVPFLAPVGPITSAFFDY